MSIWAVILSFPSAQFYLFGRTRISRVICSRGIRLPCLAIVFAEAGNRLEVWHQAGGQPHQLDIALCLDLQASGGLDAVEVTIDIQLQQRGRVIDRSAGYFRSTPANPNLSRSRLST
jgi:hypothetical protein